MNIDIQELLVDKIIADLDLDGRQLVERLIVNDFGINADAATKKAAKDLAQEAGLTLSGLINICLRQAISSRHIEINLPKPMTPKLEKLLAKAEKELEAGDFTEPFDNAEDAIATLKKRISQ